MNRCGRVLVATGDVFEAELLAGYLNEMQCETEVASNGPETLARIASLQPDLLILDGALPQISGFDICRALKSQQETEKTMVLMVSALNEAGDIEQAVAVGTDDFLSMPVNKVELVKRVENMLKIRRIRDQE